MTSFELLHRFAGLLMALMIGAPVLFLVGALLGKAAYVGFKQAIGDYRTGKATGLETLGAVAFSYLFFMCFIQSLTWGGLVFFGGLATAFGFVPPPKP